MNLLINEFLNPDSIIAKHALVRITGLTSPGGTPYQARFAAINTGQLSFQIGNEWTTIKDLTGGASDALVGGAQLIQGHISNILSSTNIKPQGSSGTYVPLFVEQYRELWRGPQKPIFAVELVIINYKNNDVRKDIMSLYSSVLPAGTAQLGAASILQTPLNYDPVNKRGFVSLEIGKWFRAMALVVDSVQATFSREVVGELDQNGFPTGNSTPLYATATVAFRPVEAIDYPTFYNYFITPPPTKT